MPTFAPIHAPLATAAIQDAIDRCHAAGGGRVTLEGGRTWVSGTLTLRARVELHLEAGAVLAASTRREDYAEAFLPGAYGCGAGGFLIQAQGAEDLAITGPGAIDGRSLEWMAGWWDAQERFIRKPKDWRPRGLSLAGCRGVRLDGFTMRDLPQWSIHLTACEDVLVHGVTIRNRLDVPNCDGIDPDRCRNVRILGCHIETGDDCIVLKNTAAPASAGDCADIVVQGCTLISTSAALKIGTESHGDFRRIVMSGCTVRGSHRGLAIQLRDHGTVEDVLVSDCIFETRRFHPRWWGDAEPIAITAVPRDDRTQVGRIRGVRLRNLLCRGENGAVIHGWPGAPIEDLTLDGVRLELATLSRWPGGRRDLRPMRGAEHGGLESGGNPGVLIRHARGLTLREVDVRFATPAQPWWTHVVDAEDVDGLRLDGVRGAAAQPGLSALRLERCRRED